MLLYCRSVVPKSSRDSVSGDGAFRRIRWNYCAQLGATLSHKKCDSPPNSTSLELKLYEDVLDVSAHPMLRGTAVFINFTRRYSVFPVFVKT